MIPDIQWSLFITELGLCALVGLVMGLDLLLPKKIDRGSFITNVSLVGLGLLTAVQPFLWGHFGSSFGGAFLQDGFSQFFKTLFLMAGIFTLFMSREYETEVRRGRAEFVALILIALTGTSFLVSANDFLLFFIALETLTLPLYIMTASMRDDERSIEAGVKYLILGAVSTAVFLFGLSFIYGSTGDTSFVAIQKVVADGAPVSFTFGMTLILASLFFKVSVFPFHFWAPDVYEGAPTPITAFLAMGSKAAGFAALIRLLMTVFMPVGDAAARIQLFAVLAALTVLYGNLGAIPQKNIKRLLAYSSIGHAGYLMTGVAAFWHTGKEAVLFYLLSYLFSTAGAFLVVVWVSNRIKSDAISDYAGLSQKSPVLAAGMLIALFSLAGVPPMAGFFAKFYILSAAVKSGLFWLAAIGLVNVVISLYYYLGIVKVMYVDPPTGGGALKVSLTQKFAQYTSMAAVLFLGIYPAPALAWIDSIFLNFLRF